MLTQRQKQTLDFIAAYQERKAGVAPTYREIKDALGLHSCGYVGNIVRQLETAGHIKRGEQRSRKIEIVPVAELSA